MVYFNKMNLIILADYENKEILWQNYNALKKLLEKNG